MRGFIEWFYSGILIEEQFSELLNKIIVWIAKQRWKSRGAIS